MPSEELEQIIYVLMAKGRTRKQAEAAIRLIGSAFARRGWTQGNPLTDDQLAETFAAFVGDDTVGDRL